MTTVARYFFSLVIFLLAACTSAPEEIQTGSDQNIVLLDPSEGILEDWEQQRLGRGETTYALSRNHLGVTIKASGNRSASILFRVFEGIDLSCKTLQWDWFVAELQQTSNLRQKGMDDVGASIMVSFGDPGPFRDKPVPILKYVWANENHIENEIIIGPYQTQYIRTIIVRTGAAAEEGLVREKRNLVNDYREAFGKPSGNKIYAIGLFTDNDDTGEPVSAYYGPIILSCDGSSD